jgi:hypothetical protein
MVLRSLGVAIPTTELATDQRYDERSHEDPQA